MKYRVVITPNAKADLRHAYRFCRMHSPAAAQRWSKGARRSIQSLAHNPLRCPLAPESSAFHQEIRELFYGTGNRGAYRILYTVRGVTVYVLHVRHGSMEPLSPAEI